MYFRILILDDDDIDSTVNDENDNSLDLSTFESWKKENTQKRILIDTIKTLPLGKTVTLGFNDHGLSGHNEQKVFSF